MKALKKRSTAVMILVAVIIAGTFLGVVRSANSASRAVEKQFFNGVYLPDDKYTEPSIQQQLDKRATAALGLLTVANNENYLTEDAKALRQSREALLEAKTIPEKYEANEKLEAAWRQVYQAMTAHGSVPASVESYVSTLQGAQGAIKNSHYNATVKEFGTEMKAFPTGLLRAVGLVNLPDAFGNI